MDFDFKITTDEGAVFEPWTDGWAVGFKVTAPDLPDRLIILNPSGGQGDGDVNATDAFVYCSDLALAEESHHFGDPECWVEVWPDEPNQRNEKED